MIIPLSKAITGVIKKREQKLNTLSFDLYRTLELDRKEIAMSGLTAVQTQLVRHNVSILTQERTIRRFDALIKTMRLAKIILETLPLPTAPLPIPSGILLKLSALLRKIGDWIDGLLLLLTIIRQLLRYQQRQIEHSTGIIEGVLVDSTIPILDYTDTESIGEVTWVSPGISVRLKRVSITKTGLARWVAIAYNNDNQEILRSDESYADQPDVLLEELKLKLQLQ